MDSEVLTVSHYDMRCHASPGVRIASELPVPCCQKNFFIAPFPGTELALLALCGTLISLGGRSSVG